MPKIFDISKYPLTFNDQLFFDNNVWIYLFYPLGNFNKDKQRKYSEFLKKVILKKNAIFINSLILSEFCNYWLQTEFQRWSKLNPGKKEYKKDFIPTQEFKDAVSDVKSALVQILQIAEKNNDDFNAINIENIIAEFGSCDFNDSYYLELARQKNWKIVTDDSDFFKNNQLSVQVLTANI